MKFSILIGAFALAAGIPLASQASVLAGGPGAGMQTATTMSNFAASVSSAAAINAGASSHVVIVPGNPNITLPDINLPAIPGFSLPNIVMPDIVISGFPPITFPSAATVTGNDIQQSGTGNVAHQVINHGTNIVQQGNGPGSSTVIVNNADQNQVRQNSVP
jgi:hypothetical protein